MMVTGGFLPSHEAKMPEAVGGTKNKQRRRGADVSAREPRNVGPGANS